MKTEKIIKKIRDEIVRARQFRFEFEKVENWRFVALFDGYIYALDYALDLLEDEN